MEGRVRQLGGLQEPRQHQQLTITWVGHSTVLVEDGDTALLTDPVLRPRVAHLRRVAPPPPPLPRIDAVLLSHLHRDHLDVPSLRQVRPGVVVVPSGAGRLLARKGFRDVVELDAGSETVVGGLTVQATEAVHDGRRHPFSRRTPALGYLVSGASRTYFAGDTDVFDAMRELAPLECALVPVWGWGPRVGPGHLDPRGAAEALELLRPRLAVPVHWGTYLRIGLPRDPATLRAPAEEFARQAADLAPGVDVRILSPGERVTLPST